MCKTFYIFKLIKVNGEKKIASKSFEYNDIPQPEDAYGISKGKAEQANQYSQVY
jgi:dTDP-4-dehydrorhamnose reductase